MDEKYYITITLSDDRKINLCLESKYAPKTVERMVSLIKSSYFDGALFHRVIENFMIQTGGYRLDGDTLSTLPDLTPIEGEFASNGYDGPALKHELGVISMARPADKNGASSQFFICSADCPWLDGEYAAFGYVTDEESKQVVLDISRMKTVVLHETMFTDFPEDIIEIKHIELT